MGRVEAGSQVSSSPLARTSYVSDMWKTPPVDILETVAAAAAEHPKLIDPHEEDAA